MVQDAIPAFPEIYAAYHGRILAFASRLIGHDEAEDVAQDVFLKVGRSLGNLADASKLTSWIYSITLNTVRDLARKRSSSPARFIEAGGSRSAEGGTEPPLAHLPDTFSYSPEEQAAWNEMVECYLDYLDRLPASYLEVYVLSEFDQLSNEDIASRLSLSLSTAKIRLHRARAKLHEELRRDCQCYRNQRGELMGEPRRSAS
jgi:RNA polymerase sigma-70 factor (ECF subfamily)